MSGSTNLTPDQQAYYLERFGERYLSVQEQPLRQSRRVRRAKIKNGVRNVRPADVAAANAQHEIRKRLSLNPLKARV